MSLTQFNFISHFFMSFPSYTYFNETIIILFSRFRSMAPMYYRRANAAMIVYDITREKSFQEAQEWVKGNNQTSHHDDSCFLIHDIVSIVKTINLFSFVELESKVDGKIGKEDPPHPTPALCVVGNKCDLTGEREVPKDRGETFAHQLGALFTETSAAENMGELEKMGYLDHACAS